MALTNIYSKCGKKGKPTPQAVSATDALPSPQSPAQSPMQSHITQPPAQSPIHIPQSPAHQSPAPQSPAPQSPAPKQSRRSQVVTEVQSIQSTQAMHAIQAIQAMQQSMQKSEPSMSFNPFCNKPIFF
jgi:hypothetical protein